MPMQEARARGKATRASRLTEDLRDAIVSGALAPGDKINLDLLRADFDVSLSPLREAVSRLIGLGLVEAEDQKGYRITPLSAANLSEVMLLRAEMESLAVGLAVARAGIDWESRVLGALHRLKRLSPGSADWAAAHGAFHAALISGAGLPLLDGFCAMLHDLSRRYWQDLPGADHAEHDTIAELAAVTRDGPRASALLRRHIEEGGKALLHRFSAPSENAQDPRPVRTDT